MQKDVMNILATELSQRYERIEPREFYRRLFPAGELDEKDAFTAGRYVGIAVRIAKEGAEGPRVRRYSLTDELGVLDELMNCDDFCITSPISYCGRKRVSRNARVMYALVVELDNLLVQDGRQVGLHNLESQWSERIGWIPRPTYIVASGNGVHLYYHFEEPLQLWPQVVESLRLYKEKLTGKVWNINTTYSWRADDIQQESIFQAFRMVGTATKAGDRTEAFIVGDKVSIEYLNSFLMDEDVKKYSIQKAYQRSTKLAEAREKWPEWYERRIVKGQARGSWVCKEDLYRWWKSRIYKGATVGHRYHCLMMLSVYAVKCDIPQEQLEADAFELMAFLEGKTEDEANHFTEKDVMSALQAFEDANCVRYSINAISNRTGIAIERNKRNGRRQALHLKLARATKGILKEAGEMRKEGRPTAEMKVKRWRMLHPDGTKAQCRDDLGLSYPTIRKWWDT